MGGSDIPEKPRVQESIFAGLRRGQFIGGACGQSCDQQPGPQVRSSARSGWGVRLSLFPCMAGGCRGAERGETLACEVTRFAGGGAAGREQAPGPGLVPVRVPTAHPWLASSARSWGGFYPMSVCPDLLPGSFPPSTVPARSPRPLVR